MIGTSARPFSVSAYSTRGGTSGNVVRRTMPSSSSARRRSDSVRGEMPPSERSSSQKRERPSARSRTMSSVHFPQTISAVRQTGQSGSGIAPQSSSRLHQLKWGYPPDRGTGAARSSREAHLDVALLRAAQHPQDQRLAAAVEHGVEVFGRAQRRGAGGHEQVAALQASGGGGRAGGDTVDQQAVAVG